MQLLHGPRPDRRRRASRSGRRLAVALAALLAVAGAPAPVVQSATAPAEAPRDAVLRGEVVETGCFVMAGRRGEAHRQCALACARAGQDLALLDDKTKTAFLLVQDFTSGVPENPLLPYVGQKVEVRGTTLERGGLKGIVVRQVKALGAPVRR